MEISQGADCISKDKISVMEFKAFGWRGKQEQN
jgi:hypothetical protein